jgi:integration host factor subunit beta
MSKTKSELVDDLVQKRKMTVQNAESVVEAIFAGIEQSLGRGEGVEIRGLGTFRVRSYKAYTGRNPKTGNVVYIGPKRLPHFKASKNLAARVNNSRAKNPLVRE